MPPTGETAVLMAIGRLQEGVDRLREDFTEEKHSAAASRKLIYERHESVADEIAQVKRDVEKLGDKIDAHQPSIDDWKRLKSLGLGVAGVLAICGLSLGALLTMGLDAFKAAMRQILGG